MKLFTVTVEFDYVVVAESEDEAEHVARKTVKQALSDYRPERLVSWKQWKEFLKDKIIMDEYHERMDYDSFVDMIETYKAPGYVNPQSGRKNQIHNEAGRKTDKNGYTWFNPEYDWDDEDGYSFSDREFS